MPTFAPMWDTVRGPGNPTKESGLLPIKPLKGISRKMFVFFLFGGWVLDPKNQKIQNIGKQKQVLFPSNLQRAFQRPETFAGDGGW